MKKIISIAFLFFSLHCLATIEIVDLTVSKPSQAEIETNRSCFRELETMGCGDPGEDIEHFRSCLNNVYSTLSKSCQNLMTDLYK